MHFLHPDACLEAVEQDPHASDRVVAIELPIHIKVVDLADALASLGLTLKYHTTPRTEN